MKKITPMKFGKYYTLGYNETIKKWQVYDDDEVIFTRGSKTICNEFFTLIEIRRRRIEKINNTKK